jgi:hypothetical protein
VKIGGLLRKDEGDWSRPYQMTICAAFLVWRSMTPEQLLTMLFIQFHTLVVGRHIDRRRLTAPSSK